MHRSTHNTLSVEDCAAILGVDPQTVRRYLNADTEKDRLHGWHFNRRWRIGRKELQNFIDRKRDEHNRDKEADCTERKGIQGKEA
jgi:DeoR/GlpR family transcriptional regulator of sugar metabolism